MDIGNIKKYFDIIILKRGYDYYINGNVKRVVTDGKNYEALVNGTRTYKVRISITEDRIDNMSCTCPYYSPNVNCKHIAAVLYYLKEGVKPIETLRFEDNVCDNKYINYFKEELEKNNLYAEECIEYDLIDEFICLVDSCCCMALDCYNKDKEEVFEFIRYLYEFIYKERWIKYNEDYYDEEDDYYYDEDYEETYDIFYDCNKIVDNVIEKIAKDNYGYQHIIDWLKTINISDIEKDVLEIACKNVDNKEKVKMLYDVVNDKINNFSKNIITYITLLYLLEKKYLNSKNAKINLMNKIVIFKRNLEYIDEVIEILFNLKEYNLIIEIIKEFNLENVEKYRKILIESYSYVDKEKNYNYIKEECFKYKTIYYYKILREKYSLNECITYYLLIEKEASVKDRISLYKFENQEDKIYDLVKTLNLDLFEEYKEYLGEKYDEIAIEKYKNDILDEYYKSYNLSKKLVEYIWHLSDIEGAESTVRDIIQAIKKKGRIVDSLKKELDIIEKTVC